MCGLDQIHHTLYTTLYAYEYICSSYLCIYLYTFICVYLSIYASWNIYISIVLHLYSYLDVNIYYMIYLSICMLVSFCIYPLSIISCVCCVSRSRQWWWRGWYISDNISKATTIFSSLTLLEALNFRHGVNPGLNSYKDYVTRVLCWFIPDRFSLKQMVLNRIHKFRLHWNAETEFEKAEEWGWGVCSGLFDNTNKGQHQRLQPSPSRKFPLLLKLNFQWSPRVDA